MSAPRVRALERRDLEAWTRMRGALWPEDGGEHDALAASFLDGPRTNPLEVLVAEADGGLVGVGSHGQFQGLGYHWEMWALASGGLEPMEVLRAATRNGAEIIGRHEEIGSLEAGKFADLVILDANPLEDITNTRRIHAVFLRGEQVDRDALSALYWSEVYGKLDPATYAAD